jgi:hypothetical protein
VNYLRTSAWMKDTRQSWFNSGTKENYPSVCHRLKTVLETVSQNYENTAMFLNGNTDVLVGGKSSLINSNSVWSAFSLRIFAMQKKI